MDTRILHCSTSIDNYNLCIINKVAGFTNRGSNQNDIIYLSVKVDKTIYCGAKFILDEITDLKPWSDADRFVHCFTVKDIEFCKPFNLNELLKFDNYWGVKFLQGSKPITNQKVLDFLKTNFEKDKISEPFQVKKLHPNYKTGDDLEPELEDIETVEVDEKYNELIKETPDQKIEIMGTFQTINFTNETDKISGLESLVNNNFYSLFAQYQNENTIMINENRMFKTEGVKNITGIRSIPDAILINFSKSGKTPIQINLIEYECYGAQRTKSVDKSNYLNSHIIPQLMLFASSFSVITDQMVRESTIKRWIEKIMTQIKNKEDYEQKATNWLKIIKPAIKEREIYLEFQKLLEDGFKNNIKILLIIDELSSEQKDTIRNVIKSFKLVNDESISFDGYVVRLVQKINILNQKSEFALTIQ